MKITLHDVAAHAGVSVATASRALSGVSVSAVSQERVRAAVSELGYVANEAARILRSDRSLTIGLIFFELKTTLGIGLIDALGDSLEAGGYSLLIASARGDAARYDTLMRRFLERRVDALICAHARGAGATLARYQTAALPVITLFDAAAAFGELPLIVPSFAEPATALVTALHSFGHRRMALIGDDSRPATLRAIAAAAAQMSLALDWIAAADGGGTGEAVRALMANVPRPTAIVAVEPIARGLLAVCRSLDIAVPGRLSIVGVTEIGADRGNRKRGLSSLVIDPQRLGRATGGAMLAWLAGARPGGRTEVQAGSWLPRATTGPAPAD
jgi:DNA-binding LacI/PurR family transcriptional regulator